MLDNIERAQILFKLARKHNWGNKYDRLEHFKRFQNLDDVIKEFSNLGWIIVRKKTNFVGISLNTQYKKEVINFIETHLPYLKGAVS